MNWRDGVPAGVEGHRIGTRSVELVERLDLAAEVGLSAALPVGVVAELRAVLAEPELEVGRGWSR